MFSHFHMYLWSQISMAAMHPVLLFSKVDIYRWFLPVYINWYFFYLLGLFVSGTILPPLADATIVIESESFQVRRQNPAVQKLFLTVPFTEEIRTRNRVVFRIRKKFPGLRSDHSSMRYHSRLRLDLLIINKNYKIP